MVLTKYFYKTGDLDGEYYKAVDNRSSYMTNDYIQMFKNELESIELSGNMAVLYATGVSIPQGEGRNAKHNNVIEVEIEDSGLAIRDISAYMMHRYIGVLQKKNKVTYANINSNTCASSMYSVYEAEQLLNSGRVDHVVVITEEKTRYNTVRVFNEMKIDVVPGEGFACAVFSRDGEGTLVRDAKWEYCYDNNPFKVSAEGYKKVYTAADVVKGHQTGTEQNDEAELEVFGECVGYKKDIGHTQGASALIEICMLLEDDSVHGNVLCVASGLGGFYGSCIVEK
jgi:hypothetical protein